MKASLIVIFALLWTLGSDSKTRILQYNGTDVRTTFAIDKKFIGNYRGSKQGFLILRADGTGAYQYDYAALSKNCNSQTIDFNWGFLLDENGHVVRFERPYGFSYPILLNASGPNSFRGCTEESMIDYLLEYKTGVITVSSSDDWKKSTN